MLFHLLPVPFCNWFQKLVSDPVYRSHRTGTMSKGNWSNLAAKLVSLLHLLPQMFGCRRFGQHFMKFDSKTNPYFPKGIVGLLLLPFGRARFHPFPKLWSCNHLIPPFYLYTFVVVKYIKCLCTSGGGSTKQVLLSRYHSPFKTSRLCIPT